ncbi:hypothetical protein ACRALDRAFT_1065997 [Sodiomyces alcalophilus JCM 7366]|uniref:uncharacterized protein n=1 Tax=Sodiomyces alcalophilus JCM 7366 TaxID=591952 RepID=UPI0039B5A35E
MVMTRNRRGRRLPSVLRWGRRLFAAAYCHCRRRRVAYSCGHDQEPRKPPPPPPGLRTKDLRGHLYL